MTDDRWVLADRSRGRGLLAFWRKNERGYTRDLDEARIYTRAAIDQKIDKNMLGPTELAIPFAKLEALARRMVTDQEHDYGKSDLYV